jgi:hypothetical protein
MDRRAFLTGGLGALIGAGAVEAAVPASGETENPLFPFYDHALLADIEAADVVVIRRPVEEELATGDGLTLAFQRYDRDDMSRTCGPPVILSKAQICSGFYMRGPVLFKLRVVVDDLEPEGLGLVLRVVLRECARVRVYAETAHGRVGVAGQPVWVDQIVVATEPLERTPA